MGATKSSGNNSGRLWGSIGLLGVALTMLALLGLALLDRPLREAIGITVDVPEDSGLAATYYPGTAPVGVLLLEGFGSDQVAMRSAALAFARRGYHVFTFDFAGHGRSPGTLGYDNAASPRLAQQTLAALARFRQESGLAEGQILLLGHSLGARVALETTTLGARPAGLILLGTQVNLGTNTQAELFTGVSDADLPWVQGLSPTNPPLPMLLISGTWDDILTPDAARRLVDRLGGRQAPAPRDLLLLPRLLHNYEPFSPRVLDEATVWADKVGGRPHTTAPSSGAGLRLAGWLAGFGGMLLGLLGGGEWVRRTRPLPAAAVKGIVITDLRRFLLGKLLLWLGGLPLGVLLSGLFFFLPLGLPTFNLVYVAVFGGYGLLLFLLYHLGRVPGTRGRLPFGPAEQSSSAPTAWTLAVTLLILTASAIYARSGWYFVFPLNMRLFWLLLFTLPTALGFWIGLHEIEMIGCAAPGRAGPQVGALLIGILPFFLYTGFLAAIGSLSGMIGGVQGLLILALALSFGTLLRRISRSHWLTALLQALLLYWLILPQGVLFG